MVKVELNLHTIAVLIGGLYCINHEVDAMAIPESVWLNIAEKLEYFLPNWDYSIISFEDWIINGLSIYPTEMLTVEDLEYLKNNTLYWEVDNGNVLLSVSMDLLFNGDDDGLQ